MTQTEGSPRRKLRVLIADDIQETRRNTRLMLATIDDVMTPVKGNPHTRYIVETALKQVLFEYEYETGAQHRKDKMH